MKIAFPSTGTTPEAPIDSRFGRAANFIVYDTDTKSFTALSNESVDAAHGAGLKAAETVVKAGVKAVVTGDCGPKAFQALSGAGVKIYATKAATAAEALELYLAGQLSEITGA